MNEYIAARQQLQEQAQQIEASEKLRMQQVRARRVLWFAFLNWCFIRHQSEPPCIGDLCTKEDCMLQRPRVVTPVMPLNIPARAPSRQQIDGLSSEIKNLITKYNNAQNTISEQQRLLEELQVRLRFRFRQEMGMCRCS